MAGTEAKVRTLRDVPVGDSCTVSKLNGTGALNKAVRDSISNFIWNRTRTRPMIIPVVMEV